VTVAGSLTLNDALALSGQPGIIEPSRTGVQLRIRQHPTCSFPRDRLRAKWGDFRLGRGGIGRTTPPGTPAGRYQPPDELLAFLSQL